MKMIAGIPKSQKAMIAAIEPASTKPPFFLFSAYLPPTIANLKARWLRELVFSLSESLTSSEQTFIIAQVVHIGNMVKGLGAPENGD